MQIGHTSNASEIGCAQTLDSTSFLPIPLNVCFTLTRNIFDRITILHSDPPQFCFTAGRLSKAHLCRRGSSYGPPGLSRSSVKVLHNISALGPIISDYSGPSLRFGRLISEYESGQIEPGQQFMQLCTGTCGNKYNPNGVALVRTRNEHQAFTELSLIKPMQVSGKNLRLARV